MLDADMLILLRQDLQRTGSIPGEEAYLLQLLKAAQGSLERQGVRPDGSADYDQLAISTAAWLYRKRVNGDHPRDPGAPGEKSGAMLWGADRGTPAVLFGGGGEPAGGPPDRDMAG